MSELLLCFSADMTVEILDYILPESLGLICCAGFVKTAPYKISRSSLTLGTSNFRHFRHLNQRTFQDQQKQATSSGGGNLTLAYEIIMEELFPFLHGIR